MFGAESGTTPWGDQLFGGPGADDLRDAESTDGEGLCGGDGNDILNASDGDGHDFLAGGPGTDTLAAGAGDDSNQGSDSFVTRRDPAVDVEYDAQWLGPAEAGPVTCVYEVLDQHGSVLERTEPVMFYVAEGAVSDHVYTIASGRFASAIPASVDMECAPFQGTG